MDASLDVLIVDDQGTIRSVLKKMLVQMAFFQGIEEASDGEDAWEKIIVQHFDLVICDVSMPRLDGIGLLKRCRTRPEFKTLPFLMISGDALPEAVASAGEWGAYDYILKPFSFSIIKTRIEYALDRFRSLEESLYREVEALKDRGGVKDALDRIAAYEQQSGLKPKWLNLKGECLMALGEMGSAETCFTKAIEVAEGYLGAYKNVALLYQKLGNYEQAIKALAQVDRLSPRDLDRKLTLGKLLVEAGREGEGKAILNKAIRQASQEEARSLRLKVAEVYLNSGNFAEAEELYVRAVKDNPEEVESFNRLGIALRRQGKLDKAETYYRLALKTHPTNPVIYYNLAILSMSRKDQRTAITYLKRALHFDPNFKQAEEALKSLEQRG